MKPVTFIASREALFLFTENFAQSPPLGYGSSGQAQPQFRMAASKEVSDLDYLVNCPNDFSPKI